MSVLTNGSGTSLDDLRDALREFNRARDWDQFHTPRNLILALTGEVGELAAAVQWIPDVEVDAALAASPLREEFEDELADCLAYLIQIADRTNVDLAASFARKLRQNAAKYPVDRARGNAAKYTKLEE